VTVDPRDTRALGIAIAEVLTSPERRAMLIERGFERAAAFSWDRTARQTLEAYEAVAAE
jgi:glycosyltransferase involved in cell wall biosynthesis